MAYSLSHSWCWYLHNMCILLFTDLITTITHININIYAMAVMSMLVSWCQHWPKFVLVPVPKGSSARSCWYLKGMVFEQFDTTFTNHMYTRDWNNWISLIFHSMFFKETSKCSIVLFSKHMYCCIQNSYMYMYIYFWKWFQIVVFLVTSFAYWSLTLLCSFNILHM